MKDREELEFAHTLKRASGMAWQGLEYRFDLLVTEFQEDKRRLIALIAITQVALLSAFMTFLCLNVLVFVLFWSTNRTAVAISMSAFYLGVTVAMILYVRWRSKSAPRPFATSLEEFKKDRAALTRVKS